MESSFLSSNNLDPLVNSSYDISGQSVVIACSLFVAVSFFVRGVNEMWLKKKKKNNEGFKIYYCADENIKWDVDLHCRLYNI